MSPSRLPAPAVFATPQSRRGSSGARRAGFASFASATGVLLLALFPWPVNAGPPTAVPLGAFGEGAVNGAARVAADSTGRIYTTDPVHGEVTVLDAFGRTLERRTGWQRPLAVAVDAAGRILVGEEATGSVTVFTPDWQRLGQLGAGPNEFILPSHIAPDPDPLSSDTVYVCDSGANQIKVYRAGRFAFSFGERGTGSGQFDFPAGIHVSSNGEVFVVDQHNDRVQVFDRAGQFLRAFLLKTGTRPGRPQGITGDSQGRLYIADSFQGFIKVFSPEGSFLSTLGSYGEGRGQLRSPAGLAIDRFGRLLVASVNNCRLELLGLDAYVHLTASAPTPRVQAGGSVTLSITVSGAEPLSYQWYRNGGVLGDGDGIAGATTARLTLEGLSASDSGGYSVMVLGADGESILSPVAALTILSPPVLLAHPANRVVLNGSVVSFLAVATGDGLLFQWRRDGQEIPGATASALLLTGVKPADAGRYSLLVTNALGSVESAAATLTVVTPPQQTAISALEPMPDGGMRLLLLGDPGFDYDVEASTDLGGWAPLATLVGDTSPVEFIDGEATLLPCRFYRLRWVHPLLP